MNPDPHFLRSCVCVCVCICVHVSIECAQPLGKGLAMASLLYTTVADLLPEALTLWSPRVVAGGLILTTSLMAWLQVLMS
jgi:hypothetical protein